MYEFFSRAPGNAQVRECALRVFHSTFFISEMVSALKLVRGQGVDCLFLFFGRLFSPASKNERTVRDTAPDVRGRRFFSPIARGLHFERRRAMNAPHTRRPTYLHTIRLFKMR